MQFITLLLIPHIIVWILTRSRRAYRWLMIAALLTVQLISILPLIIIGIVVLKPPQSAISTMALAGIYKNHTVTQAALHGLPGWEGVDIKAGCGEPIYAPFAGTVTYNGLDGYNHLGIYEQSTMLTIKNDEMELTLLHGDYHLPVGSQVQARDVIGRENSHGWSTGCHSHVILKENGRILNYLEWLPKNYASYPLRISWYDPSLGGTNCDHDCTTMASGDKVASWLGGRGGVYAAACPRSDGWHHGKRFVLDGTIYECRDTGGWINCYQPGQYDPALKRQADMAYCWVDLLNNSSYGYGNLAYDWGWVQ